MLIFAHTITPRLRYIALFLEKTLTGTPVNVTDNRDYYLRDTGARINYSAERLTDTELWLAPQRLLFESGIREVFPEIKLLDGIPYFFEGDGDFPFDIFSASFFLVSRYEEYQPFTPDPYGRYPHEQSLAFRENFLHIPLVNHWLNMFGRTLQYKFPELKLKEAAFALQPTYDIDEAWSFRNKTWSRSAGGALKDLLKGNFGRFAQRRRVLNGKEADPYDSFTWMDDLHRPLDLKPHYFFLIPASNGKYDKNNLPSNTAMQTLIRQHAEKYTIGLHPSWQSGDDFSLIQKEKETLEKITGLKITSSRQHYIRLTLPLTYRALEAAGIKDDYSMGYGSINGFRASISMAYPWYDLEKETVTHLTVHPFCFMEANSFYEQKMLPQEAAIELKKYAEELKKAKGEMITIWHNTFFGTEPRFAGWKEIWQQFLHA